MKCKTCINKWACDINHEWYNPYNIKKQVKFAVLATYANIGKPKGEDYEL